MSAPPSRDQVLAAARSAYSGDHPPSMVEFAAAAGTSLRRLYRLFGSRHALLQELGSEPPAGARERILEAAFELLGRSGLADLSMDELAALAGVSRATLYRAFPGKSVLFRELIATYSPWEPITRVLDACRGSGETRPEYVIPQVARAVATAMSGRIAVLLRMVIEMANGNPDTAEGVSSAEARGLPDLVAYLNEQIALGRLRPMDPILAVQLLAGPIVAHELTHPLAALMGFTMPREQVVEQFVEAWLRSMAPTGGERGASDE